MVLVVEDDPGIAWATGADLRASGFLPVLVSDGEAALDFAAQIQVDVILLDLHMPVMDGWMFLQRRRQSPALRKIPVIIASSSYEHAGDVADDVEAILPKPLPRETLIAQVNAVLARRAIAR